MGAFAQTWHAPGNSLSEWNSIQVAAGSNDRLQIVQPPVVKSGTAFRAEVRDGDVAVNANGQPIGGGWRAEGVGPVEIHSGDTVRFTWSTMLDAAYSVNPVGANGQAIWQVITQWHQTDQDGGASPPVAFIIVQNQILLHLHRFDPANLLGSIEVGQYPVATDLARGAWDDFQMDVRWALVGGWVKVWHNGVLMQDISPVATLFPRKADVNQPGSNYLKMGLYRKPTPATPSGPFVLYHDEVRRSQE